MWRFGHWPGLAWGAGISEVCYEFRVTFFHMNPSTKPSMGIFWSAYNDNFEDNDQQKKGGISLEASPDIRVLIIYEQPQGTGLHMNVTLDPTRASLDLKSDLSNMTSVPVENIALIHKNSPLQDETSLYNQGVEDHDTIVLRDTRLKYSFP